MTGIGAIYGDTRTRLSDLVAGLTDDEAATVVPTCPEWTVHDVIAHLAGVCVDVLAGNIEGVASEPWTAAQVEARRDRPIGALIEEWTEAATQVEAFADAFPGRTGQQWVTDITSHEHDVRHALGRPGARDSAGVMTGVEFLIDTGLAGGLTAARLGPLEVRLAGADPRVVGAADSKDTRSPDELFTAAVLAGEDLPVGDAPPVAMLEASAFDLMRALSGRRSLAQVAAMAWSSDPAPYLPLFTWGPFTPSGGPVVE